MEASSSSNTANVMIESVVDNKTKISFDSVGGRKSEEIVAELVEVSSDDVSSDELSVEDDEDYDVEEDSDEEDSEEEDDEEAKEDNERARILADLWELKKLAEFFQHPEKPVEVDGFAAGRSFFSRPDAADVLSEDEDEELVDMLADAQALKKAATAFLHPEHALVTDAAACARNYFSQPWASEQETFGQAEQRAHLVEESHQLKERATTYRHPEAPVDMDSGMSMTRNYFLRPSAPETEVDANEGALILEEMKALKRLAVDYMHPELDVEIEVTAGARNYFLRPSAPEQEEDEYADEREVLLEEMKELKEAAQVYRHPESPLEIDPTATARSYFDDAPEEEAAEREAILQEMQAMKKLAVTFMHPERPLEVDAAACGCNYFTRPSAPEQMEGVEELILEEMKALKKLALDYKHPERPVEMDPAATGRNYFLRASAPEQEEDEYGDERDVVLEEMKELKQAAIDFMHPERPVEFESTSTARNYFDRASSPNQEDAAEREAILEEMRALKKLAVDYRHPELPLEVDAASHSRNYFMRPSAPEQEDEDYDDCEAILKEMQQMKQLASDYWHPEKALDVDATAVGRNYFTRPSAPEWDGEGTEEREMILKEVSLLKERAVDFMHPERPVDVNPSAFGRNYYGRASAAEQESFAEAEARASAILVAMELKKSAELYLHPEKPLEVDATAGGRNYFSRASAYESDSDEEERAQALKDAEELKKLASAYMHPEAPLSVDPTVFGRNFYGRASAPSDESFEAEERKNVLADVTSLKKLAVGFAHPEMPVATSDPAVFGRNYFSRLSASEQNSLEEAEERAQVLAELSSLKKLAVDYLHPEKPVDTTDPTATGRNYFVRPSARGVSEDISSSGHANVPAQKVEEVSHHDDYGHFEMDEEMFYEMRQSIVLPLAGESNIGLPKVQSSKMSSEEEGELSRSPSSVMLFTGALEDADHPPLPTMG